MSNLRKAFGVAIGAGEQAIRINTDEIDDCLRTIRDVCKKFGWELRVWDKTVGTIWYTPKLDEEEVTSKKSSIADQLNTQGPPNALGEVLKFWSELPKIDKGQQSEVRPIILVMKNFHLPFERQREDMVSVVQHIVSDKVGDHPNYDSKKSMFDSHGIEPKSDTGKFLVGLMPAEANLPPEVSPLFKVIEHTIPDEEELKLISEGIIPAKTNDEDEIASISDETRKKMCKFALGLTRLQAEGVFSSCMVQFGEDENFEKLLPEYVWTEKSKILNKEGLVTLYQGKETFDDVVGLEGAKTLLKDLLAPDKYDPNNSELRSRGLALIGQPRVGKSLIAKAAGNTLGLPTLMVDIGSWFGGLVGDSERLTRKGFQIIRAHSPCIAVIDELEKVMPSAKGGEHDSGVGKRMAGSFMTQLQDIQEPVFWVFTANGVEDLHEAFLADDRVDGVVYVHMPGPASRAACWKMYIRKFFPKEVNEKPFPWYIETDFNDVITNFKQEKKVNPITWANRFIHSLLCLHGEEREKALLKLESLDNNVYQTVIKSLIDDSNWTPARIKSVCRLARKRAKPLSSISKMMPRNQRGLNRAIAKLERWAEDEAIDAETGEAYIPESDKEEPSTKTKREDGDKVRRKVRRMKDEDE